MKRAEVGFLIEVVEQNTRLNAAMDLLKYKMEMDVKNSSTKTRATLNQDELDEVLCVAGWLDAEIDCPCDHFKEDCDDVHE